MPSASGSRQPLGDGVLDRRADLGADTRHELAGAALSADGPLARVIRRRQFVLSAGRAVRRPVGHPPGPPESSVPPSADSQRRDHPAQHGSMQFAGAVLQERTRRQHR